MSGDCGLFNYTLTIDSIDESLLNVIPFLGASIDFTQLSGGFQTTAAIEQRLVDYPLVVALTEFSVKAYTWEWLDIQDQVYRVGDSVLSINLPHRALPDEDLFTRIEVTSTEGSSVLDFAFLDPEANSFEVQTDSNEDVGIYNLTLVATFPEFPGQNITSNFTL